MSDLQCQEFVELVTAFLDHSLDDETQQLVIDHLALCDGCERYLHQLQQTIEVLANLPAETLPEHTKNALLTAFRERRG